MKRRTARQDNGGQGQGKHEESWHGPSWALLPLHHHYHHYATNAVALVQVGLTTGQKGQFRTQPGLVCNGYNWSGL
eukprot:1158759-Pelagomonas_calceolata.AAC.3